MLGVTGRESETAWNKLGETFSTLEWLRRRLQYAGMGFWVDTGREFKAAGCYWERFE